MNNHNLDIIKVLDSVPDRFKNVVSATIENRVDAFVVTFELVFFYSKIQKVVIVNKLRLEENDITKDLSVVIGELCAQIKYIGLGGN